MTLEIRNMQAGDIKDAHKLWKRLAGISLSSADEDCHLRFFIKKNPSTCFVAVKEGELVGTILGGSDGRRGFIYHLAVSMQFQRQNIGKLLTEACLKALKELGIMKCHIFVLRENTEGVKFWEKTGWQLRHDILIMSKDL